MVTSSFFFGLTLTFRASLNLILFNIIMEFYVHSLLTTFSFMPRLITPRTKLHTTNTLTINRILFNIYIFFAIRSYTKFYQRIALNLSPEFKFFIFLVH